MKNVVRRLFVEKKKGFDVEAQHLCKNIKDNLGIHGLEGIRVINRYDVSGISDDEFQKSKTTIFSEPNVDRVYDEVLEINDEERILAIEFLPGQYDQRADSASQCIQILTQKEKPLVNVAKLMLLKGDINEAEIAKAKAKELEILGGSKEPVIVNQDNSTNDNSTNSSSTSVTGKSTVPLAYSDAYYFGT